MIFAMPETDCPPLSIIWRAWRTFSWVRSAGRPRCFPRLRDAPSGLRIAAQRSARHLSLDALAPAKFRLAEAVAKAIADHREVREQTAFDQAVMFPQSGLEFETTADDALTFDENSYAYNQSYRGGALRSANTSPALSTTSNQTARSTNARSISTIFQR